MTDGSTSSQNNNTSTAANAVSPNPAQEGLETRALTAPVVLRDRCARSKCARASCHACLDACPAGAISLDGGAPVIDASSCLACELCCAACALDVILSTNTSVAERCLAVEHAARLYDVAYVTCINTQASSLHESVVEVPCLGMLTPEFWFSCLASNPNIEVYLPVGTCDECPCTGGEERMVAAISKAEEWACAQLGLTVEEDNLDFQLLEGARESIDRRGLFTGVAKKARNIARANNAVSAVEEFRLQQARMRNKLSTAQRAKQQRDAAFEEAHRTGILSLEMKILTENRRMLLDTLAAHGELASSAMLRTSVTDTSLCVLCGDCTRHCPLHARRMDAAGIQVDASYCTGCGLCVETCMGRACDLVEKSAAELGLASGD